MSWGSDPEREVVGPSYTYSYSVSPYGPAAPRRQGFFGRTEVIHIAIAVAVLTAAFTLIMWDGSSDTLLWSLAVAAPTVVLGFFLHEMAHKYMARRYGCWAEFRAYNMGLFLALAMSFFGFLFAAPGAVYIAGSITREQNGRISLAGPATNLVIAMACLPFAFSDALPSAAEDMAFSLLFFNSFLAVFNLVPVAPLDGSKVWAWNKPVYVASMAMAVSLLVLAWL
ncbi:MAG: site-2 protease family protein [Candidatus Thermoplasmatota archaeon]